MYLGFSFKNTSVIQLNSSVFIHKSEIFVQRHAFCDTDTNVIINQMAMKSAHVHAHAAKQLWLADS